MSDVTFFFFNGLVSFIPLLCRSLLSNFSLSLEACNFFGLSNETAMFFQINFGKPHGLRKKELKLMME